MPKTVEEKRAEWRAMYARQYPEGFKRRRNAEQTRKQAASQARYRKRPHVICMRRLQVSVRNYLRGSGNSDEAASLVGCSPDKLRAHLDATLQGQDVLQWHLSYHRHPREFNLENLDDRKVCFHYTNMYARPVRLRTTAFQPPSLPVPLRASSSRAVLETEV